MPLVPTQVGIHDPFPGAWATQDAALDGWGDQPPPWARRTGYTAWWSEEGPPVPIRRQEGSALQGPAPRLLLLRAVTAPTWGTSALWESRAGLASPRGGSCWNWAAPQNPEHRGTLRALHAPSTSIPHPQAVVPRPAHPKGLLGWQGRIRPEGQAGLRPGPASAGSMSWNFSVGLGFPSRNRELLSWGGVRGPWPLTWGCLYPVASGV